MNIRTLLFTLVIVVLGATPLAAQNSPAGGLASGHVINRDVDTYMMVNFAPFVNYDNLFTFAQIAYTQVHAPMPLTQLPGFQAGLGKKINGSFLHFYLNTSGYAMNDVTTKTDSAGTLLEDSKKDGTFNMQFDTAFGNGDLGTFKVGMNFFGINKKETFEDINVNDYKKITSHSGYFFPTIEYGWNKINDDFSMLLLGAKVGLRIPMNNGSTITEEYTGGIKTTTTTVAATANDYPAADFYNNKRLEIVPQMYIFFKPKLEPMVIISHVYLINTLSFQFYPDQIKTIERAGFSDGYTRREHSYVGNTLLGYYNRQYSITSRFTAAWRVYFSGGFYYDKKGYTKTAATAGAAETETKVSNEVLYWTVNISPRLSFGYQLIPATLAVNGGIIFNAIGPTNAIGWQMYRRTETDDSADKKVVKDEHLFNGINPKFNVGAAWNIHPHILIEAGISLNTTSASNVLDEISVGLVYKK